MIHPATDPPPLSREGAIAVVVAEHPTPVRRALWVRLLLMVLGSAVIAAGVATLLWTGLGPGPLDVFITAVVDRWGIPITFVVWGVAAFIMSITTLLGHRPGLGTLALPLISGALLPFCMSALDRFTPPEGLTVFGIAVHLVAILVPSLRPVFRTYAMSPDEWMILLGLSALVVPAVEIAKAIDRGIRKTAKA